VDAVEWVELRDSLARASFESERKLLESVIAEATGA